MGMHPTVLNLFVTALIVVFIVATGSRATLFDGLPLSDVEALVVFVGFALVWTTQWWRRRLARPMVIGGLTLLLALQFIGSAYIPHGWSVCLRRGVSVELLTTPCEPSAQFRRGERTFVMDRLDFAGTSFPLYFMNDARSFNFYESDIADRQHLPYHFAAEAFFRPTREAFLTLRTSVPTVVRIGPSTYEAAAGQETVLSLPAGELAQVTLLYSTLRHDDDYFVVQSEAEPYWTSTLPSPLSVRVYGIVFAIALAMVAVPLVLAGVRQSLKLPRPLLAGFAFLYFFLAWWSRATVLPYLVYTVVVLGLSWVFVCRRSAVRRQLRPLVFVALLVSTSVFVSAENPYPTVTMGSAGRDTFSHLSVARQQYIWQDWPSFIGDGVFYLQPMHRYLLGGAMKILDESFWGPYVLQTFLAALAVILTVRLLCTYGSREMAVFFSLAFLLMNGAGLVAQPWLSPFLVTQTPYQQGMSVPILLLGMLLTVEAGLRGLWRPHHQFWLGLLVGLGVMIRMNYVPVLVGMVGAWLMAVRAVGWRLRAASGAALLAGLAVVPSLVALKNYLAAGVVQISTTSATINQYSGFRHIVPHEPSSMSAGAMVWTIVRWYEGRWGELLLVLLENLRLEFIGEALAHQVLWYGTIPLVVLGWRQARGSARALLVLLVVLFVPVLSMNLFFRIHPASFEMHIPYDYLLLVMASVSAGILWRRDRTPPTA